MYAERAQNMLQLFVLVGYGVVIGLAMALCVALADPTARLLVPVADLLRGRVGGGRESARAARCVGCGRRLALHDPALG